MKIGILGCGWLGTRVATKLSSTHEIFTTSRSAENCNHLKKLNFRAFQMDFEQEMEMEAAISKQFQNLNTIIISLPVSKNAFSSAVFHHVQAFLKDYNGQMILFSSLGIYPQTNGIYTENSEENLNENILAAEIFYKKAFPKLNILRLGGLMGDKRKFSNYFQNKNISAPEDPVNHVHYEDVTEIIALLIQKQINAKLYNVVAPFHPTKKQILHFQREGLISTVQPPLKGRIVSGAYLVKDLNYAFTKPNPMYF